MSNYHCFFPLKRLTLSPVSPLPKCIFYYMKCRCQAIYSILCRLNAFNEFYSAQLGEDVYRGMIAAAKAGYAMGGVTPFGLRRVPVILESGGIKKKYELHPEQAPVVKKIYELYISGMGLYQVARALNAEGIKTKTGKEWEITSIHHILHKFQFTPLREGRQNDAGMGRLPRRTKGGSITQPPQLPITDRGITLKYHSNPPPAAPPTEPQDWPSAPHTDHTATYPRPYLQSQPTGTVGRS